MQHSSHWELLLYIFSIDNRSVGSSFHPLFFSHLRNIRNIGREAHFFFILISASTIYFLRNYSHCSECSTYLLCLLYHSFVSLFLFFFFSFLLFFPFCWMAFVRRSLYDIIIIVINDYDCYFWNESFLSAWIMDRWKNCDEARTSFFSKLRVFRIFICVATSLYTNCYIQQRMHFVTASGTRVGCSKSNELPVFSHLGI